MQTIMLYTIEDVFEYGINRLLDINTKFIFSNNFDFIFRVYGKHWNDEIDYKISDFILCQQKEILKIYNDITGNKINLLKLEDIEKRLRISYKVYNGSMLVRANSSQLLNDFVDPEKNIFEKAVDKMTGRELLILFIAYLIISTLGGLGREYLLNCRHEISAKKDETIRLKEIDTINKSMEIVSENSKGILEIVKYMHNGDKISIGNKYYEPSEANEIFNPINQQYKKEETIYCDGVYNIDRPHMRGHDISISQGNKKERVASFATLSSYDKQILIKKFSEAAFNDSVAEFRLNINATLREGRIKNLTIIGLGEPRIGSIPLEDAIKKYGYDSKQQTASKDSKLLLGLLAKEQN